VATLAARVIDVSRSRRAPVPRVDGRDLAHRWVGGRHAHGFDAGPYGERL